MDWKGKVFVVRIEVESSSDHYYVGVTEPDETFQMPQRSCREQEEGEYQVTGPRPPFFNHQEYEIVEDPTAWIESMKEAGFTFTKI